LPDSCHRWKCCSSASAWWRLPLRPSHVSFARDCIHTVVQKLAIWEEKSVRLMHPHDLSSWVGIKGGLFLTQAVLARLLAITLGAELVASITRPGNPLSRPHTPPGHDAWIGVLCVMHFFFCRELRLSVWKLRVKVARSFGRCERFQVIVEEARKRGRYPCSW
jgi:hypothetical protein